MDYYQWMLDYTGDSLRGIARKLGVKGASNLSKQARIYLSADRVIEIAHAYGKDPIEALRQTGHIKPAGKAVDKTAAQLIDEAIDPLQSAKASTTLDIYAHLWPGSDGLIREAVSRLKI